MQFKTLPQKLVARICAYCRENNLLPPGQVRTTKLVYLIECDYYGWEQKRLTDLGDWIFWHYGPWSKTLSIILKDDFGQPVEEEAEPGKFKPVYWKPPEFDVPKLKFDSVSTEGVILRTLERFADMPYGKLLDYVYFDTEPMRDVVRGKQLNFAAIPKTKLFIDPVSLLPKQAFHRLRKGFEHLEISELSEPKYEEFIDQDFLDLMANLDSEGSFFLPEGEVFIDSQAKANLKRLSED